MAPRLRRPSALCSLLLAAAVLAALLAVGAEPQASPAASPQPSPPQSSPPLPTPAPQNATNATSAPPARQEGPPPRAVVAVANRDAEGAVVVDADETKNYQPTAAACRDDCNATAGCNVWVWCGEVSGCSSGGGNGQGNAGKYRQCWLKYDIPPSGGRLWPRYKNAIDQATGWTSGTTDPRVNDSAPVPERSYSCSCQSNYTADGYRFLGVCAALGDYSNNQCMVDASCGGNYYNGNLQGCTWTQPCTVLLDTDLAEDKVLVWGDGNTADSAEDCSGQCGRTRGCNLWTWCSDARGCSGEVYRFRQCWLKQADPLHPVAKAGYGGSPGWVSGVRLAYLPV